MYNYDNGSFSEDAYFLMKTDQYKQSESIKSKVCMCRYSHIYIYIYIYMYIILILFAST